MLPTGGRVLPDAGQKSSGFLSGQKTFGFLHGQKIAGLEGLSPGKSARMRLFISINFDDAVKRELLDVQATIRAQAFKGTFPQSENLHLTLVFLGEAGVERIPAIRAIMGTINETPFELSFTRLGHFTRGGKELWWIGIEERESGLSSLMNIRGELCQGLKAAGIAFDDRPFKAHITLGRQIKRRQPLFVPDVNIAVPVSRINLIKSEHIEKRLVHTEIFARELPPFSS
jgi:2'-5' RNA ligase